MSYLFIFSQRSSTTIFFRFLLIFSDKNYHLAKFCPKSFKTLNSNINERINFFLIEHFGKLKKTIPINFPKKNSNNLQKAMIFLNHLSKNRILPIKLVSRTGKSNVSNGYKYFLKSTDSQ